MSSTNFAPHSNTNKFNCDLHSSYNSRGGSSNNQGEDFFTTKAILISLSLTPPLLDPFVKYVLKQTISLPNANIVLIRTFNHNQFLKPTTLLHNPLQINHGIQIQASHVISPLIFKT